MAQSIHDLEFGTITVRRSRASRHIRLSYTSSGVISASMPPLTPIYLLKQLIDTSRQDLREMLAKTEIKTPSYRDGERIGASHRIILLTNTISDSAVVRGQAIYWHVPTGHDPSHEQYQNSVRKAVRKALDTEAKAYLPRRLATLAQTYNFSYKKLRYGNAKGRWGSCTSAGTISLNVALMNLPPDIIDYVLVHELCHTRHMNHSQQFWDEVARCYPDFKHARKQLKTYTPYL